jgi:hypothetical protein
MSSIKVTSSAKARAYTNSVSMVAPFLIGSSFGDTNLIRLGATAQ